MPPTSRYIGDVKRFAVIAGAIGIVFLIVLAIAPMWVMTSDVDLPTPAIAAIIFMIIGCFVVGGGLMFLIFYSARKGYDDSAHGGGSSRGMDKDRNS
jgi:hypothetical protein